MRTTESSIVFCEGRIEATVDLRVYRLAAVQKAAYRFAERFTVVLGTQHDHVQPIAFVFRPSTAEPDALDAFRLFFEELLDQELREHIGEETRAIRALIIAQAFSRTDLVKRDQR
jgi:His-Xaa-Ser system protein HxsD